LYAKLTRSPVPYTERDVAGVMYVVLSVLAHCHAMGVGVRTWLPLV
jgi:hypothetical protein